MGKKCKKVSFCFWTFLCVNPQSVAVLSRWEPVLLRSVRARTAAVAVASASPTLATTPWLSVTWSQPFPATWTALWPSKYELPPCLHTKFLNYTLQYKINTTLSFSFHSQTRWRAEMGLNGGPTATSMTWVSFLLSLITSQFVDLEFGPYRTSNSRAKDTRVVFTHPLLALTCCEWRWTRSLLLDITFALILIRYAAKAVVRRWIGVTMSSLVLFHFPWWHIFLWRLTLGQTLHSHRLWTIEN